MCRQVPKLQSTFSTQLLSAIDDECIKNNEIAKKIARRMELFSELGYYQSKVNELRDEREKRSGKGKPESADNIEKFDRNCKKLGRNTTQTVGRGRSPLARTPHAGARFAVSLCLRCRIFSFMHTLLLYVRGIDGVQRRSERRTRS